MCETYGIDDKTRFLVLYFDAKMDAHAIAKIINRSERTLLYWVSRTKSGEDIRIIKKGRGCKKTIKEETENRIIQMVYENPEGASIRKLAARSGISKNSISRILAERGFRYQRYDQSIVYEEEERMNRVDFCKKMLSEESRLIYRTFFSDEMGVELNSTHKSRGWQIPAEKVRRKNVIFNIKLDCWGAISAQGATALEIYKKGLKGDFYRQIIENHKEDMEKLYPDGEFYFVQDSHPVHRMNEEWIVRDQKIELISFPKRSPDLNIIENLWITLKDRVKSDGPTNENELRASLLKNWAILTTPDRMRKCFEGLERRYQECIGLDGNKLSG